MGTGLKASGNTEIHTLIILGRMDRGTQVGQIATKETLSNLTFKFKSED